MKNYEVYLHNTSSLESQRLLITNDYNEAEDLFCDIKRVLSADMKMTIEEFEDKEDFEADEERYLSYATDGQDNDEDEDKFLYECDSWL